MSRLDRRACYDLSGLGPLGLPTVQIDLRGHTHSADVVTCATTVNNVVTKRVVEGPQETTLKRSDNGRESYGTCRTRFDNRLAVRQQTYGDSHVNSVGEGGVDGFCLDTATAGADMEVAVRAITHTTTQKSLFISIPPCQDLPRLRGTGPPPRADNLEAIQRIGRVQLAKNRQSSNR
jgi:hypothetical protein